MLTPALQQILFSSNAGIFNGMVGYWQPDLVDTVGLTDRSRNGNTLTNNNTVAQAAGPSANLPYAASFVAASSQYLSVNSNASLVTGDVDFSITAWVYLASKGADRVIAGRWTTTGNQREFRLAFLSGSDRFGIVTSVDGTGGTGATLLADVLGSPALNTWYFLRAWHDSGSNLLNIQANNGAVNSVSYATGVFAGTGQFTIGKQDNGAPWDGNITQVMYWKRLNQSNEPGYLWNNGSGRDLRRAA